MRKLGSLRARTREATAREAKAPTPTSYRTFSRKLAPSLIGFGGALAAIGAAGAWIRTSEVVAEGLAEEQVGTVMGHTSDWGRLLGALGILAAAGSIVWLGRRLLPKIASVLVTGAVIGIGIARLLVIDEQAASFANQAGAGEIDFISFHAGLGWGAWCMIAGGVALALGVIVGILREIDLRTGMPE